MSGLQGHVLSPYTNVFMCTLVLAVLATSERVCMEGGFFSAYSFILKTLSFWGNKTVS